MSQNTDVYLLPVLWYQLFLQCNGTAESTVSYIFVCFRRPADIHAVPRYHVTGTAAVYISMTAALTGDLLFAEPERFTEKKRLVRCANKWIYRETKGRWVLNLADSLATLLNTAQD